MQFPAAMMPAQPSLATPPLPEGQRKADRRDLKMRRAEQDAIQRERRERQSLIDSIENEKETAAAKHVADCEPKQKRLAAIRQQQVVEHVDALENDPSLEAERARLQGEIDQANDVLQEIVRRCDDRIKPIQDELRKLPAATPPIVFESKLVALGQPALLRELFSCHIESYWAKQRADFSRGVEQVYAERLDAAKKERAGAEVIAELTEAHAKFAFEARAAGEALTEARLNCDRLRQQAIDE